MATYEEVRTQMRGEDTIRCSCPTCGWDNDGRLVLVDRYATDHPSIPRVDVREVYLTDYLDPDDRVSECVCGEPLDPDAVVVL